MGLNTTDDSREGIANYLLWNPNTCFVAEDNGKIAGVIMSADDGHRGLTARIQRAWNRKKLVDSALEAEDIHMEDI